MNYYHILYIALCTALPTLLAHRPPTSHMIHFHSTSIDTRMSLQFFEEHTYRLHSTTGVRYQFLIQLTDRTDASERMVLESLLDQKLQHYYHDNTWLTYSTYEQIHRIQHLTSIQWIGLYKPEYKVHDTINNGIPIKPATEEHSFHAMSTNVNHTHHSTVDSVGRSFLNVHLPIAHTDDELYRMISEWTSDWSTMYDIDIHTKKAKSNKIIVYLHDESLVDGITEYLSHQPSVQIITRRPLIHLLNQWSRTLTSNGLSTSDYTTKSDMLSFEHNLQGQNQIIGIGDSGLDWQSCFFHDPKFPNGPTFREYTDTTPVSQMYTDSDSQHRKIVQYVTFADRDDDNGHGTHVVGSAVGSTHQSVSYSTVNGIASEAKVAFFDLGLGETGGLDLPPSLDEHYLQWSYTAGARIHSASWGSDYNGYDTEAYEIDHFQWEHPDLLVLVAAGNDGIHGARTVGSPGTSKNVLTVGASMNAPQMFYQTFCNGGYLPTTALCGAIHNYPKVYTEESMAGFSSQGPTLDGRLKPEIVAPGLFILSAKIGQTASSSCQATPQTLLNFNAGTSMSAPITAGNVAIIRQYFMEGWYPSGIKNVGDGFTPSGALMKAMVIAGARALTGSIDTNAYLFTHTSSSPSTQPLQPPPNNVQGFGRLQLNNSLSFFGSDSTTLIYRPTVNVDTYGDPIFSTANAVPLTYKFCQTGNLYSKQPTKITLVWTDYPGSINSPNVLVNNLDLSVTDGTDTWLGNGVINNYQADTIHNVEQVILPPLIMKTNTTRKMYTITVKPIKILYAQSYSLVITGKITAGTCDGPTVETYLWVPLEYGICSKPCGTGIQSRTIVCKSSIMGLVDDAFCIAHVTEPPPAATQSCNTVACTSVTYEWSMSSWSGCSVSCGTGTQTRTVVCKTITSTPVMTDDANCLDHSKPLMSQTCNTEACDITSSSSLKARWVLGTCPCSITCTCIRSVTCYFGDLKVGDTFCDGTKPPALIPCTDYPCTGQASTGVNRNEVFEWSVSDWSSCTVGCGGGMQTRTAKCRSSLGYYDMDNRCPQPKPITSHQCNNDPCPSPDDSTGNYQWIVGTYGSCNLESHTQSRWIVCANTLSRYDDSSKCEAHVGVKPPQTRSCTVTNTTASEWKKPIIWSWWADRFGDPSRWCGSGGIQTRSIWCLGTAGLVGTTKQDCSTGGAGKMPVSVIAAGTSLCGTCTNSTCAPTPQWYGGIYMGCTSIDPCNGTEHRHVFCISSDGTKLADRSKCDQSSMLPTFRFPCGACSNPPKSVTQLSNTQLSSASGVLPSWVVIVSVVVSMMIGFVHG